LQVRGAEVVPGANDNASGVATVLRLAERHGGRLEHFDLWVLLTAAEEGMLLGMREWLRAHRDELDPERTIFVNVDIAGYGTVRYTTREGLAFPRSHARELIELCEQIRDEDHERRYDARPLDSRLVTDAYVPTLHGYRAIQITCLPELNIAPHYHQPSDTPDHLQPEALERAFEFCSQLIQRIDQRLASQAIAAPRRAC
jgi:Zn-dependent M28 family amino/carboxypeptidase